MSGSNGMCTNSEVPTSFSGVDSPVISSGVIQCGDWQLQSSNFNIECIDGVPSECRVIITGAGVQKISNSKQQCALSVSIQSGTVQLNAEVSDALNRQQQSATLPVSWVSDNSMIATVNESGLVTLIRKGQAVISARYSRGVNPDSPTTAPSATEATCVYAECLLTIGA